MQTYQDAVNQFADIPDEWWHPHKLHMYVLAHGRREYLLVRYNAAAADALKRMKKKKATPRPPYIRFRVFPVCVNHHAAHDNALCFVMCGMMINADWKNAKADVRRSWSSFLLFHPLEGIKRRH